MRLEYTILRDKPNYTDFNYRDVMFRLSKPYTKNMILERIKEIELYVYY